MTIPNPLAASCDKKSPLRILEVSARGRTHGATSRRLTFRYTENGPEGLLQGKKAYVVIASGGVPIGSDYDFASPYLRQVLAFVGITNVEFVAAEQLNSKFDESIDAARVRIAEIVYTSSRSNPRAA